MEAGIQQGGYQNGEGNGKDEQPFDHGIFLEKRFHLHPLLTVFSIALTVRIVNKGR